MSQTSGLRCTAALLGAAVVLGARQSDGAKPADPAITRADIEACVRTLSSDEMNGRNAGTEDCVKAGEYLAAALERAGVAPAGDDGGYAQKVPMVEIAYRSIPKVVGWTGPDATREFASGTDFVLTGGAPSKKSRLRVRIVKSADQMPKVADDEVALFLDAGLRERREWLGESRGAGFGLVITPGSTGPGKKLDDAPPRSRTLSGDAATSMTATMQANGELLAGLRDGSVKAVNLECSTDVQQRSAFNVVGRIAGVGTKTDPKLADEVIVFSAHYDHIGVDSRITGEGVDRIRNGADDDASGCAAVLELAEAFAAGPKPARTLLFFFATGEEQGLFGTYYYLDHPIAPLDKTVCNLNFEMIGRPDDLVGGAGKLWLTGYELSNLGSEFQKLGVPIVEDRRPEQNFFKRSDNYAFAVKGIVAQTLSTYNMHREYHQVGDEADTLDFAHMETCVRAAYEGSKALADGRLRPEWAEGKNPRR